jgi:hypothetical protein
LDAHLKANELDHVWAQCKLRHAVRHQYALVPVLGALADRIGADLAHGVAQMLFPQLVTPILDRTARARLPQPTLEFAWRGRRVPLASLLP